MSSLALSFFLPRLLTSVIESTVIPAMSSLYTSCCGQSFRVCNREGDPKAPATVRVPAIGLSGLGLVGVLYSLYRTLIECRVLLDTKADLRLISGEVMRDLQLEDRLERLESHRVGDVVGADGKCLSVLGVAKVEIELGLEHSFPL